MFIHVLCTIRRVEKGQRARGHININSVSVSVTIYHNTGVKDNPELSDTVHYCSFFNSYAMKTAIVSQNVASASSLDSSSFTIIPLKHRFFRILTIL